MCVEHLLSEANTYTVTCGPLIHSDLDRFEANIGLNMACIHCTQVSETSFDLLFLEKSPNCFVLEFQKQVLETFVVYAGLKWRRLDACFMTRVKRKLANQTQEAIQWNPS